jgi:cytochrome c oxidase assembly protein subunit 15
MGWYMVKSGLKDIPHVSHYRLSMHLMFAVIIYMILFAQAVREHFLDSDKIKGINRNWLLFILTLIIIQIFIGGLVAGLDAGLIYNTFPLMNGKFIPEDIYSPLYINFLENSSTVQFIHRIFAYFISLNIIGFVIYHYKFKNIALLLFTALVVQVGLGILTLINSVPLILASLHQIGAIFLLSTVQYIYLRS